MGVLMTLFSNAPTPCDGETFSSWLFRCSYSHWKIIPDRTRLLACPGWTWSGGLINVADPDFDFNASFFVQACKILKVDRHLISVYFRFRNEGLVSWEHRYWFCPECLRDDVQDGKIPAWRKEWCSSYSVFCGIHRIELVRLRGRPTYSKAWDAYVQICNQEVVESSWEKENFVRLRYVFFSNIKRWMNLTVKCGEMQEIDGRLFRRLYCVFLQLPNGRTDAGVARTFFHQGRVKTHSDLLTFKENLFLCSQVSDPRSRFGSMMLLGILLEIISQQYFSVFDRYCEMAKVYFPPTSGIENTIYLGGLSRNDFGYLHEFLGTFSRGKWPKLDVFIGRQEARYRQAGVCSGMKLGERPSSNDS
jgi:hypothetical protein